MTWQATSITLICGRWFINWSLVLILLKGLSSATCMTGISWVVFLSFQLGNYINSFYMLLSTLFVFVDDCVKGILRLLWFSLRLSVSTLCFFIYQIRFLSYLNICCQGFSLDLFRVISLLNPIAYNLSIRQVIFLLKWVILALREKARKLLLRNGLIFQKCTTWYNIFIFVRLLSFIVVDDYFKVRIYVFLLLYEHCYILS